MTGPPVTPEAAALYDDTAGIHTHDADNDWAGAELCTGVMAPYEVVGRVARNPALWADPVNAPDEIIRNMAMRKGLRGAYGQSIARLRERIANTSAAQVGSSEAIAEAVRGILTPAVVGVPAHVRVLSGRRLDGTVQWGYTTVVVRGDEASGVTLDQVRVAAEQGAPDWVVIEPWIGRLWMDEASRHATWSAAAAVHPTWTDMVRSTT